jgi:hypothetical protein
MRNRQQGEPSELARALGKFNGDRTNALKKIQ